MLKEALNMSETRSRWEEYREYNQARTLVRIKVKHLNTTCESCRLTYNSILGSPILSLKRLKLELESNFMRT